MNDKRLILILRLGVGNPTSAETEVMKDLVGDLDSDEAIAVGTPLSGPSLPIPIPGINNDGHLLSVIQTEFSAAEVSRKLSEADDFLPALCIDITDHVENKDDGNISINAQLAASTGIGGLFQSVFGLEPEGEFDEEEYERERSKRKKKKKKPGIEDLIGKLDELEKLKDALQEASGSDTPRYKRKSCKLNLDQLLDLVAEKGIDGLTEEQRVRLDELSKSQ
jgi:hypothetical protein